MRRDDRLYNKAKQGRRTCFGFICITYTMSDIHRILIKLSHRISPLEPGNWVILPYPSPEMPLINPKSVTEAVRQH